MLTNSILLNTVNQSIAFTKKEIQGIKEYKKALTAYVELLERPHPSVALAKLSEAARTSSMDVWNISGLDETNNIEEYLVRLREIIHTIGDESKLMLDPEMPSYYAVDILINQIPRHIMWADNAARGHLPMKDSLEYSLLRLEHARKVIDKHGESNPELERLFQLIHKDWQKLTLFKPIKHRDALLTNIIKLSEATTTTLKRLLQQRLQNDELLRYKIIIIILGFYFIIIGLVIVSTRYYVGRQELHAAKQRSVLLKKLSEKNAELERFAHIAAHDLKEPVRTIRCYATLLKIEAAPQISGSAADYISVIENTSERAEQMINDLLGYAQASDNGTDLRICDCNAEVAAVLEDLQTAIRESAADIHVERLPALQLSPAMFRRVMLNLIDNAIKYRRENVPLVIHIRASREKDTWVFAVQDNGIGVLSSEKETLFELFRRGSSERQGSGVGLAVSRKVISNLNGTIWLDANQGGGTTAYFTLPV